MFSSCSVHGPFLVQPLLLLLPVRVERFDLRDRTVSHHHYLAGDLGHKELTDRQRETEREEGEGVGGGGEIVMRRKRR